MGVVELVDPELAMPDHPWVGLLTFDCRNIAFVDRVQVCLQRLASRYRGTKWICFFLVEDENLINCIPSIEDRGDLTWLK